MEINKLETASVKVMRSHDYCHFEVCLSISNPANLEAVNELRKEAARLADKAVEQYKVAKVNAQRLITEKNEREYLVRRVAETRAIPEQDRTVRQQAELKAFDDAAWEASRPYDYQDDWQDDQ